MEYHLSLELICLCLIKPTRQLTLFRSFNEAENRDISKTSNFVMLVVIAVLAITQMGH